MFYTNVFRIKNSVIHVGYDKGKKFVHEVPFEPHFGVQCREETGYKTLDGKNVKKITFDSIYDWSKFKKENPDTHLYDDIDPVYQFIVEKYPDQIDYNVPDVQVLYYDIEVMAEDGDTGEFPDPEFAKIPICSISAKLSKSKNFYVFGYHTFDQSNLNEKFDTDRVVYIHCENEKDLLQKFLKLFNKARPDVITGWNIDRFDTPYLINRVKNVLGSDALKLMSYFTTPTCEVKWFNNQKEYKIKIPGVTQFDLLPLYKKKYPLESYALNVVAEHELKKKKLNYSHHKNIFEFYQQDPQLFYEYNMYDVELVYLLEKKLGIIKTYINLAYLHKCTYEDTLSQTRAWDQIMFDYLSKQNIMIPPRSNLAKDQYVGAYVKDVQPGVYDWVASFDVNSMYPSLVMQFNISPETILGRVDKVSLSYPDKKYLDKEFKNNEDYILAANGVAFKKDVEGFAAKLMRHLYTERVKCKKQLLRFKTLLEKAKEEKNEVDIEKYTAKVSEFKGEDDARKVSLNSYYGALGNEYFRYYDVRMAEAITLTGQYAIVKVGTNVEETLQKKFKIKDPIWIYGDTDSNFFVLDKMNVFEESDDQNTKIDKVDTFCDDVIQPIINKTFRDITEKFNCNTNDLVMKREKIAEHGLWKAKKHYCLYVWDDEKTRLSSPKIIAKGIQLIQSSTPTVIKPWLREAIIHIMKSPRGLQDYINEVQCEFFKLPPEQIASPRTANNIEKYRDQKNIFSKGCPIHVRAAIVYNACIDRGDFTGDKIIEGEKIRFIHMKTPNYYFNSNVVGFTSDFPYDIKYVDYQKQFEKTYLDIVEELAKAIGLNFGAQLSLEDLF